jgi:purine-binding chemotaxis protein CheW
VTLPHNLTSLLRVHLGGAVIGLPATAVREIVRAVAITPVPGAPPIIEGAVNLRGQLVPVVDVRRRLALPAKALDPDEFLVVMQHGTRTLALRVDDVDDLVEIDADAVEASAELSPALRGLAGLSARADGVLVIYDPAAFVSQAEADAVDVLMTTLA